MDAEILKFYKTFLTLEWLLVSQQKARQPSYGKLTEEQLKIMDDVPSSAVELQVKDKVSISVFNLFLLF